MMPWHPGSTVAIEQRFGNKGEKALVDYYWLSGGIGVEAEATMG